MSLNLGEVIVGCCTSALLKSYSESVPVILTNHKHPTIDLKFDEEITIEQLTTKSKFEAWLMLKFLCAMRGLIINHEDLEYVRVEQDQIRFRGAEVQFKKCHLFPGPTVRTDLERSSISGQDSYKIIDFMRLKFCDASNLVPIFLKDSFISRIESTGKKQLYSVSYLTKEQLTDFDYSDTMVRFIVQKLLVEREDIHRPIIHSGSDARRIPKLEVMERAVLPMEEVEYKSTRKIKFYDRKKRINIVKAYRRNHTSI